MRQRKPGCRRLAEPAEGRDDTDLTFLDDVEAAAEPDHQRGGEHRQHTEARAARLGSGLHAAEPPRRRGLRHVCQTSPFHAAIEVTPQFIEIGRPLLPSLALRLCGVLRSCPPPEPLPRPHWGSFSDMAWSSAVGVGIRRSFNETRA